MYMTKSSLLLLMSTVKLKRHTWFMMWWQTNLPLRWVKTLCSYCSTVYFKYLSEIQTSRNTHDLMFWMVLGFRYEEIIWRIRIYRKLKTFLNKSRMKMPIISLQSVGMAIGPGNVENCLLTSFQYQPIGLKHSWLSVGQPIRFWLIVV